MFKLKNTCKGWAGMQAAIKKKKTVTQKVLLLSKKATDSLLILHINVNIYI